MIVEGGTTITGYYTDENQWRLESDTHGGAVIPLVLDRPDLLEPQWARYPAGVLAELCRADHRLPGFAGRVSTTLPVGGGLSSSASLEIAVARIALDGPDSPGPPMSDVELARICQRAEHTATNVRCGIMDQLSIVSGRPGYATMIDCSSLTVTYVRLPNDVIFEYRFVTERTLIGSEYSERVGQCEEIERCIGPLRHASESDLECLSSPLLVRRARHVVSENRRVRAFADALTSGLYVEAGRLMTESHRSLADDFGTSTAQMDSAVASALTEPGVLGARMTGGGFGGCIVVMRRR